MQRRTRQLFQSGIIASTYEIDYRQFGYKTGLLHVYLKDGDSHEMAEQISKIESILDVSIHIGNSDLVAKYACKNTEALLNLLAEVKRTTAVTKIVWSEEVYHFPQRKIVEIPHSYKRRVLDNQ